MTNLIEQIAWQFLIFQRNNLVAMISGITAFYVLVIYFIKDLPGVEKFVTLLIYNDPAIVGFIFIGISIILEKDQDVLPALFVTPVNIHSYLAARILTLSTFGFLGSIPMVLAAKGSAFNPLLFFAGTFSTCVLFCLLGVFVVSFTTEVLHFLLRSIPLLIFMSLPLLNYFELTDLSLLKFFPVQGGLDLIVNSYRPEPNVLEVFRGIILIIIWLPLLYWVAFRKFTGRIVGV